MLLAPMRALSEKVAEKSVAIARHLAESAVAIHRVTMLLAAVVAFGALCVSVGYTLRCAREAPLGNDAETVAPFKERRAWARGAERLALLHGQ